MARERVISSSLSSDCIWLYGKVTKGGFAPNGSLLCRAYMTDSEDLAEYGVKDFLRDVEPFLGAQGVTPEDVTEEFEVGGGYSLTWNGRQFVFYNRQELVQGNIWSLTTDRAFAMINTFLSEAKSPERVYLLYGGNDAIAVFLTTQYELIRDFPLIPAEEKPVFAA